MYRVIEVARMLGVSKVTIYKKMRYLKDEIKPYVVKDKNITHITGEGVELIKGTLQVQDFETEAKESLKLVETQNKLKNSELVCDKIKRQSESLSAAQINRLKKYRDQLIDVLTYKHGVVKSLNDQIEQTQFVSTELTNQINLFKEINRTSH